MHQIFLLCLNFVRYLQYNLNRRNEVQELSERKFWRPDPYIAAGTVEEPVIGFLRVTSKPAEPDNQD